MAANLLPAIYGTLSKLWLASIDNSLLSTGDAYTYYSIITEVLNEGLPRAAWSTIGDASSQNEIERFNLLFTLINVQAIAGALLSIIMIIVAPSFVSAFVPGTARSISIEYIRISAFNAFASTITTSVALGTRALDQPQVPVIIAACSTSLQIILELILVSTVRIGGFNPSILTQAKIRLSVELVGSAAGLIYFINLVRKKLNTVKSQRLLSDAASSEAQIQPSFFISRKCFMILLRPGRWTMLESAVRNGIYLYLIHNIVLLGQVYATAWGVFNTIRWGVVMVPIIALEQTSNTFVGHRFAEYMESSKGTILATWRDVKYITRPAIVSAFIGLIYEAPICLFLSLYGIRPFSLFISASKDVADVVEMMWRSIDWCYIFFGVSTPLASILLATKTSWYLNQSLVANIFYVLPWTIVIGQISVDPNDAWFYYAFVFGGSLVVSFVIVVITDALWARKLMRGKLFFKMNQSSFE